MTFLPFYLQLRKQQKAARSAWSLRSAPDSQPLPCAEGRGGAFWGSGAARLVFGVLRKALSAAVVARLQEGENPPAVMGIGSALSLFPLLAAVGAAAGARRRPGRDPAQPGVREAAGLAPPPGSAPVPGASGALFFIHVLRFGGRLLCC